MRLLLVMLVLSLAAAAWAQPIMVPGEHTYVEDVQPGTPPDTSWVTATVTTIQGGINLAAYLTYEHPFAGYPGHVDSVLIQPGTYDSVHYFPTPLGGRSAVAWIHDDITLVGVDRGDVKINYENADYGIVCMNVSRDAVVANLTILGGDTRSAGGLDDGDGRLLTAGIGCIDAASPTIRNVDIENGATGIIIRTDSSNSAPLIEGVVVARGTHHGIYIYNTGTEPTVVDRCTIVDNFDYGISANSASVEVSNSAITHNGKYGLISYLANVTASYCNVYWNDHMFPGEGGPLNYGGELEDLTGTNGNISAEPYYCDFDGDAGYDYHVCRTDPVSPHYQAGEGGVTIGAYGAVCTGCQSPVNEITWGAIKALYR
jgi:hypothetical protein